MTHPLLYEINTRCWLRELSDRAGKTIRLGNVPDTELDRWQQAGFTHVWLMGVWTTGPKSRAQAVQNPHLVAEYDRCLPGWKAEDVAGSPYAIADYTVPRALGGGTGLKSFRRKLNQRGLRLILDFVPNHVGRDHAWLGERPDLFVQSETEQPETFAQPTAAGTRWLAYGKDPNFQAWTDTVQLDYRRAPTRAAMLDVLQAVVAQCDGVRCDMAMLVLNDVFARTWDRLPVTEEPPAGEFWSEAITAVRKSHPDCLFLGEVYWALEGRLQALGFDYTYNKRVYDHLVHRQPAELQAYLVGLTPEFLQASAHFLENHDEPRIANLLALGEHRAAALLTLGLPGLRLLHDGQLSGASIRTPVQLGRRPAEPPVPEVESVYGPLLRAVQTSAVNHGNGQVLAPRPAWDHNRSFNYCVAVLWQHDAPAFDLVVVNLAWHRSQCYVPLPLPDLTRYNWEMKDLLGDEVYQRNGDDLQSQGLYLDLPENGALVFHFRPVV